MSDLAKKLRAYVDGKRWTAGLKIEDIAAAADRIESLERQLAEAQGKVADYQIREIGESDWRSVSKEQMEAVRSDPHMDYRIVEAGDRKPFAWVCGDDMSLHFVKWREGLPNSVNVRALYLSPDDLREALIEIATAKNFTATDAQFARHLQWMAADAVGIERLSPAAEVKPEYNCMAKWPFPKSSANGGE